ncbi:hypothetical protein FBUS_09576 [Fasciolopsis buskii]|uniref:Uncharacterized protein n=1 Tax=Fasciolopsis buskii TaxID=27845 RepID=A0A8E0RQ97_9TREM|nr:hypothetical protein FBUS_09576 [Fasciolopsis buski]
METDDVTVSVVKNEQDKESDEKTGDDSDSAVELWWETFLKQKRAEDALDAEIRAAWENCSQRRLKFAREVQKITELYQPIEKLLHTVLESDNIHRGDSLYREWGRCYVFSYYARLNPFYMRKQASKSRSLRRCSQFRARYSF